MTINKFFTDTSATTDLTALAQGNVYVLDNITFDEEDLTSNPYTKSKRVTVKVTMMNWESNNIGWEL